MGSISFGEWASSVEAARNQRRATQRGEVRDGARRIQICPISALWITRWKLKQIYIGYGSFAEKSRWLVCDNALPMRGRLAWPVEGRMSLLQAGKRELPPLA